MKINNGFMYKNKIEKVKGNLQNARDFLNTYIQQRISI